MSKFRGKSVLLPKSAATIRRLAEEKARVSAVKREHLKALTPEEMQGVAHELRVHQLQLEMQNEELRRVQDELESSRSQYVELYDMAPTGYFTVNEKALILEVNLTGASILGTPRTKLLGKCFSSFVSQGSQDAFYLYLKDLAAINERRTVEIQMVKHDGAVLWALCSGSVSKEWTEDLHADSSKETVFHLAISDITAGKRDAALLHEGDMRFRELFTRHGSVMLVNDPDTGTIVEANDSAVRFYGWSAEELKTMTIMQINNLPPEVVKEEMARAKASGKYFFEFRHKRADGSIRNVEVFSSLIDTDGKGLLYSVVVDVTERKRSEAVLLENKAIALEKQVLQESAANFRTFFETMTDMIMVGTPEGQILYTNSAVRRKLGYSQEELKGIPLLDLHPADRREEAGKIFAAMFKGEREGCPLPLVAKNGNLVPVETRVWFGKWDGKDCVFGISKDLAVEQEAKQLFELLFRNNPALMAISTAEDNRLADVNDAFLSTLGYSREDVIGKTAAELDLFPDAGQYFLALAKLQTRGHLASLDMQVRCSDGSLLYCRFSGEMIRSQGKARLLTVMVDITERKEIEEELLQARNRLALAARAGGVGIWDYDVVNNRLIWDEQMFKLYGITKDQFSGAYDAWQRGLHPEDKQRGDEEIQLALTGKKDFDIEFRVVWPDGSIHNIRAFALVQRDAAGRALSMVGTNWDITSRKRAEGAIVRYAVLQRGVMYLASGFVNVLHERQEAAVSESLARIGRLINADRSKIFIYDFNKQFLSCTSEWCADGIEHDIENLGAVPAALFPDWVDADKRGNIFQIPSSASLPADSSIRQMLEQKGIRSLITLPMMNGSDCLGFIAFEAMRKDRIWNEEEVSLLRVFADIHAALRMRHVSEKETSDLQQVLVAARDAAQEAARAKSLFLANMSHEIRTPLNAILGYAQIMERECRDCPTGNRLHAITRSGEHLLELITNLLELVSSDSRAIRPASSNFDLYRALEDVRLMFAQRPEVQNLTLEVSCGAEVPQFVCADEGKVRQILVNLVGNAIKFTEKGHVLIKVSAVGGEAAQDDIMLVVDVEDTGEGIPDAEVGLVFDLFYLGNSAKRIGKGTGLGLPLSRRFARAMGGDVTVAASTPGVGSCFRFTFKAVRVAEGAKLSAGRVARLAPGQSQQRILIVDDDVESREMLATMLEQVGFSVETVHGASQALLRLSQAWNVDLVLMDKNMPEMNGIEAIGRIRQLSGSRTLRVLVVSAASGDDEKAQALAAGADGYVSKPVRRELLLEEIGVHCGIRYEYEPTVSAVSGGKGKTGIDLEALAGLPEEQRLLLEHSLRRGDVRQLRDLVAAIASERAGLATGIKAFVDAYDYDGLRRVLDSVKRKSE